MRKTNRRIKMPRHYGNGKRSSGMTTPKPKKKTVKKNGTKKKK